MSVTIFAISLIIGIGNKKDQLIVILQDVTDNSMNQEEQLYLLAFVTNDKNKILVLKK